MFADDPVRSGLQILSRFFVESHQIILKNNMKIKIKGPIFYKNFTCKYILSMHLIVAHLIFMNKGRSQFGTINNVTF